MLIMMTLRNEETCQQLDPAPTGRASTQLNSLLIMQNPNRAEQSRAEEENPFWPGRVCQVVTALSGTQRRLFSFSSFSAGHLSAFALFSFAKGKEGGMVGSGKGHQFSFK